ncbi:hypothetical protein [uncultured Sphingomonas sp.]|uniref:hypothetical protein n=1 Tax=uncultured Sphingomonas sp. TaxID=158754 RepID=UPI0035CAA9FB
MSGRRRPSTGTPAAHAALRRGIAFVSARIGCGGLVGRHGSACSVRVVGNMLAEIDRLLVVLISEVARDRDLPFTGRSRDPGVILSALRGPRHSASPDGTRLRALYRSTSCLRRDDGVVTRVDRRGGRSMTVGWPRVETDIARTHTAALGSSILPSAVQLIDVCAFYDRLGREIVATDIAVRPARPFHGHAPHPV